MGWQAVWVNRFTPEAYWFGSRSQLLLDRCGPAAEVLKAQIVNPTKDYPYPDYYLVWLSPNGNTLSPALSWMVKFSGAMTAWICCANVWAKDEN